MEEFIGRICVLHVWNEQSMGCVIGGHQIMTSIPTNTPFHNMLRYNRIEENEILLCLLEQFRVLSVLLQNLDQPNHVGADRGGNWDGFRANLLHSPRQLLLHGSRKRDEIRSCFRFFRRLRLLLFLCFDFRSENSDGFLSVREYSLRSQNSQVPTSST